MNRFKKLAVFLSLLAGLSGIGFGQASLTQTTLAAQQNVGPSGISSGVNNPYQTIVSLTSATGITQSFNGQPVTFIWVGGEVEGILQAVTGQTTIFNVLRAQMGTKAAQHPSGDMVLAQIVTPQLGGNTGSGGFQAADPPNGGGCTATNTLVTPWLNVFSGAQWLCSTVTNTWVPGWNNPLSPGAAKVTTAVASAAGLITPSGPLFHVTGTSAITGFNIPVGFNATAFGGGCFVVIPDAVFTYTAANNIGLASTGLNAGTAVVVVNQPITFCWDATNSKFLPNTQ